MWLRNSRQGRDFESAGRAFNTEISWPAAETPMWKLWHEKMDFQVRNCFRICSTRPNCWETDVRDIRGGSSSTKYPTKESETVWTCAPSGGSSTFSAQEVNPPRYSPPAKSLIPRCLSWRILHRSFLFVQQRSATLRNVLQMIYVLAKASRSRPSSRMDGGDSGSGTYLNYTDQLK